MRVPSVRVLFLFLSILCVACEVGVPKGVIAPDRMEAFLYDYHLAQAVTADELSSSYKKKLHVNYVFDKHGLTKEELDSSLVWYTRYPKQLSRIYANLEKKLIAEMETMGVVTASDDAFNLLMASADTVNLWREAKVKLLSSVALSNKLTFKYKADSTYVKGDSISFSFTAKHLNAGIDSVAYKAHAALVVEYDDNSSATCGVNISRDGAYAVSVERNYVCGIKSLHGFLYYTDNDSLCMPQLLVGDIAVKRIHPLLGR